MQSWLSKSVTSIKEVVAVEVKGKFDVQRFFDTLALILSARENVKITVTVTQKEKEAQEIEERLGGDGL